MDIAFFISLLCSYQSKFICMYRVVEVQKKASKTSMPESNMNSVR